MLAGPLKFLTLRKQSAYMRNLLVFIFAILVLLGCKGKKTSLSGNEKVEVADFIAFFPEAKLPFTIADTAIGRKMNDATVIGSPVLASFVPDSMFTKEFGKEGKPKFYAIGRVSDKNKETYLFLKAATAAKQVGYVLVFDKDSKFKAGMPIVRNSSSRESFNTGSMDSKYTIALNKQRRNADGQVFYKKDAYVYNSEGAFTLILTESNELVQPKVIDNPIDTMRRNFKYSGDYVQDAKNLVSVRDGRKAGLVMVFIHFEKNKGDCRGELKGEFAMTSATTAIYRHVGDACAVQLDFTPTNVKMKELEGCGNHRDIRCLFEGTYTKKKVAKPKETKPKAKK